VEDPQKNIALISRFIQACVRADPDEFAIYFTDDAVWWNSPWLPVRGRDAIRETLRKGSQKMAALPWEIRHIVADGNIVVTERVDHFLTRKSACPAWGSLNCRMERSLPGVTIGT
jgi:uncharacterized protein (TIGR02246 family)